MKDASNNKINFTSYATETVYLNQKHYRFGPAIPMPRKTKVEVEYYTTKMDSTTGDYS